MNINNRPTRFSIETLFFFSCVLVLIIFWSFNFQLLDKDDLSSRHSDAFFKRNVDSEQNDAIGGFSTNKESVNGEYKALSRNNIVEDSVETSSYLGNHISAVHNSLQTNANTDESIWKKNHHPTKLLVPSHNPKFHFKKKMHPDLQSYINITYNVKKHRQVDFTFNVENDISSFLDYAIIGMPKTGTTSILKLLSDHTLTLDNKERCDLNINDIPLLVNDLYKLKSNAYNRLPSKKTPITGIKCPLDISSFTSLQNYASYFNGSKLIVGLRHPIKWFESFYNFRVRNMNNMPSTKKLLNNCGKGSHGVCAWRANISDFLYQLNKTTTQCFDNKRSSMDDNCLKEQMQYISLKNTKRVEGHVGKVFIYLIDQFEVEYLEQKLIRDLFKFLDIKFPTQNPSRQNDTVILHVPKISTVGALDHIPGIKETTMKDTIDICDDQHQKIRDVLMDKARKASIWIRDYFLESDDVHVSSRDFVHKKLKDWMDDPCTVH